MENTTVIFKVDFGDTAQKAVELTKKIEDLANSLKLLKDQFGTNSKEFKLLEAELKANQTQLKEYEKAIEKGIAMQEKQADSLESLKQKRKDEIAAYSKLSEQQRNNAELGIKQAETIRNLEKEIKALEGNLKAVKEETAKVVEQQVKQEGSLSDLQDKLKEAKKAYFELSKEQRENAEIGGVQRANIAALEKEIGSVQGELKEYVKD